MQHQDDASQERKSTRAEIAALAHQLFLARNSTDRRDVDDWLQAESFLNLPKAIDQRSLEWMPKSVWGPIKWKELHTRGLIDLSMEEEQKWFETYVEGLPCPKCRSHFQAFLADQPPDLSSRPNFFAWTVRAHNHVNQALGKPTLTEKQARQVHQFVPDPPA
jgi:Erv1 / Alr family/Protein of unknown function (DUF2934)